MLKSNAKFQNERATIEHRPKKGGRNVAILHNEFVTISKLSLVCPLF